MILYYRPLAGRAKLLRTEISPFRPCSQIVVVIDRNCLSGAFLRYGELFDQFFGEFF